MVSNTSPFNVLQLVTWKQAKDLMLEFNFHGVGGGIKPLTKDPLTSGIYHPEWLPGPAGFPEPGYEDANGAQYFPLCFRFNNGGDGMNIGLALDRFRRYPSSPRYVWDQLSLEANSIAKG